MSYDPDRERTTAGAADTLGLAIGSTPTLGPDGHELGITHRLVTNHQISTGHVWKFQKTVLFETQDQLDRRQERVWVERGITQTLDKRLVIERSLTRRCFASEYTQGGRFRRTAIGRERLLFRTRSRR